jgi:hypothetical protein
VGASAAAALLSMLLIVGDIHRVELKKSLLPGPGPDNLCPRRNRAERTSHMTGATPALSSRTRFARTSSHASAHRVLSQLGSPITAEVLGLAGFDWILLDSEHAPNDPLSLVPQLMALKDSPSAPVVRPHWNDGVVVKR